MQSLVNFHKFYERGKNQGFNLDSDLIICTRLT